MSEPRPANVPPGDSGSVVALITLVASGASVLLALTATDTWQVARSESTASVAFLALTLVLGVIVVDVYGRGTVSFAGSGRLAIGFALGPGPAMAAAALSAVMTSAQRRAPVHKAVFDAAGSVLATGAATAVFHAPFAQSLTGFLRLGPAVAAGVIYMVVNVGLLCLVMALSEGGRAPAIWNERFRWFTPYFLASGPLALALVIAYERLGVAGLLAFSLPPAFMMLSVRQYLARTKAAVEEARAANDELAARNSDLQVLFGLSGGLAARTHDLTGLVEYVERSLAALTGTPVRVELGDAAHGTPLVAGGTVVGSLHLDEGAVSDRERWERLKGAVLPTLATAIESAELVEQLRKTHIATIAALSKSMEAKDYYTGGHTERVAEVSVALARELGYTGAELDAVEVGALLHDIGKIGIPERILHKPGPLDDEEWVVMREHPVISDYILSEVDLPKIVRQIARSSHERMDGTGYPDRLSGDDIPLPARIVLVADAFDALTSDRPYRAGRHTLAALEELRRHAGTQFCPQVVAALERVYRKQPELLTGFTLRAVEDVA